MTLWTPSGPNFQSKLYNSDGIVGTGVAFGASNAKGSWVELFAGAAVTHDVLAVLVKVWSLGANAIESQGLLDIGIDNAAGGSYTVLIPDLVCGNCGTVTSAELAGPHYFYFPLFIKSGTQIAARGQTNNTGGRTAAVQLTLFGLPKYPEFVKAGSFVTSFGVSTSVSAGTTITPGSSFAEGAYVSLSGGGTSNPYWFWQYGYGIRDTTMQALGYWNDIALGDASNKFLVINNHGVQSTTNERTEKSLISLSECYFEAPTGTIVYGRATCSGGSPDSNYSIAAYGVGG